MVLISRICISESSEYATSLGTLLTNYSLDTTGPIEEDLTIYGRIAKYAFANVDVMSSSQTEALCEAAVLALRQAASRDVHLAISCLSEPWARSLARSTVSDDTDDSPPICSIILENSPRSFLLLLQTLSILSIPSPEPFARSHLSRGLTVILLALHSIAVDSAPDPLAVSPYNAFTQSAILVKEWPSDLSSDSQAWHHLFIWSGGSFITEATGMSELTPGFQATAELTAVVSGALTRMADALRMAIQKGWYNCGYKGAVFPWPACMFSATSDTLTNAQGGPGRTTAIKVLHKLAPQSLDALLDVLELAVAAGQFYSRQAVDYDIRLARAYIVAPPHKQDRTLLWRQRLGANGSESSNYKCSYHLP